MPITTVQDPAAGILRVTITGDLPSIEEMVSERARLIVAGHLKDDTLELIDIRGLTGPMPSMERSRTILVALGRPPAKRAFVAGSDVQYGVGRMVEALLPGAMRVFRDEASAVAWLKSGG